MAGMNQRSPDSEVLIFRQNSQWGQRQCLRMANAYPGKHNITDNSIVRFGHERQVFHKFGAMSQSVNKIVLISIRMLCSRKSLFYDFSNRVNVRFLFNPHINHFVHITVNAFFSCG